MENNKPDENDVIPIYPEVQKISLIQNHNNSNNVNTGTNSKDIITLKVVRPGTDPIDFSMKTLTKMKKLMVVYCKETGLSLAGLRFLFDGKRISSTDTPKSLGLENYDVIDVFQVQSGGCETIFKNCIRNL